MSKTAQSRLVAVAVLAILISMVVMQWEGIGDDDDSSIDDDDSAEGSRE